MKGTEHFKATIKQYLDERAKADEQFAASYGKPNKTLDECISYILTKVRKSGCNGFADDEIYGMAVHYYDEDNIGADDLIESKCDVVVNHQVELTEDEKIAAHKRAVEEYQQSLVASMKRKDTERAKKQAEYKEQIEQSQLSLFDL